MHPDEIRARLALIFALNLGVHKDDVTDATLIEDIASDSLEVAHAMMEIESSFGIEISDMDADTLVTVGDIVSVVEGYTKNLRSAPRAAGR